MRVTLLTNLLFFSLLTLIGSASHAQNLEASLDRNTIEFGDTLTFSVVYRGDAKQQSPDFSVLTNNFDILSYYPSFSEINNNGVVTLINSWELVLDPKIKGKLLIPPIAFMGEFTKAIELNVNEPSATPAAGKDIFLETIVDKSSAYVQEQIAVTFKLYFSVQIEAEPVPLEISDAVVKQLDTRQYQRRIDGKMYRVAEVPYIVFGQRSGAIVIPQTSWKIRVAVAGSRPSLFGNFGRYKLRQIESQEKVIRIKPIPDNYPAGAPWLPADALDVKETWSNSDLTQLSVGEPVTRTIEVKGRGVEAAQIPMLMSPPSTGSTKYYLEPAQLEDTLESYGIVGTRTESAAIVLSTEGETNTDEIRIHWWNTNTDSLETHVIPAKTLNAKAKPSAQVPVSLPEIDAVNRPAVENHLGSPTSAENTTKDNNWLVIVLASSNILLLAVIIFLLLKTKKPRSNVSSSEKPLSRDHDLSALITQLNRFKPNSDELALYQAIQHYAAKHHGGLNKLKLAASSQRATSLSTVINELERNLYTQQAHSCIESKDTKRAIEELKLMVESRVKSSRTDAKLAHLY